MEPSRMKMNHNRCGTMAATSEPPVTRDVRSLWHGLAWLTVVVGLLAGSPGVPAQTYTILHSFSGPPSDGDFGGGMLVTNSIIYGVTDFGGSNNAGTVYSIGTDGSNYQLLHNFAGSPSDGATPSGLRLVGSTLYGSTVSGGSSDFGTLFAIGTGGNNYTILHNFAGSPSDGRLPLDFEIMNSIIYGVTEMGGSNGSNGLYGPVSGGTLYSIGTGGGSITILHNFGSATDGTMPVLFTLAGSTIYGTTWYGGSNGSNGLYGPVSGGTLYSISTGGKNYTILHNFGSATDGTLPQYFEVNGSTIYGVTAFGGSSSSGTVYSISTGGGSITILHDFAGSPTDGAGPEFLLPLTGSTLYGSCASGGSNDAGTVFSIGTGGNNYTILHNFAGSSPIYPGLCGIVGSTLYGVTDYGGSSSSGSVFSVGTGGNNYTILHNFPGSPEDGWSLSDQILVGSTLYGTTQAGGTNDHGVIFALTVSGGGTPTKIIGLSGNLAFGSVMTGTTATATLSIGNSGNTNLMVSGIGYPTGFSGAFSGTIPAGGSQNVTVTFAPTAVTSYGGTITVTSDATSGADTIAASGTGVATPATVAAPTITPDGGDFADSVKVTLKCATHKAVIHYTTDGTEPTSDSPKYKSAITLTNSATLNAVAFAGTNGPSATATASFTVNTPSITTASELPGGTVAVAYSGVTLQATGGTPPYKWSLAPKSKLPAGLKLGSTGKITGKPTKAGAATFTVKVTDAKKGTGEESLSVTVSE